MSISQNIMDLATRAATESKSLRTLINGNAGDLSALTTTAKGNLVLAINELKASSASVINDTAASAATTYSSTKINAEISSAVSGLVNGAGTTLDTLKELGDALGNDSNFAATVSSSLGNRLRFDTATQALTLPQQLNARTNINVYSKEEVYTKTETYDKTEVYNKIEIGDPTTDYVAIFNTGLI